VTRPEALPSRHDLSGPLFHPPGPVALGSAGSGPGGAGPTVGGGSPSPAPAPGASLLAAVTQPAGSALRLSASTLSAAVGHEVRYLARVLPGGAGGVVKFLDGGDAISGCENVPVTAGQAVCSVRYASAGSHAISAVFSSSSPLLLGASSTTLGQTVTDQPGTDDGEGGAAPEASSRPDEGDATSDGAPQDGPATPPSDQGGHGSSHHGGDHHGEDGGDSGGGGGGDS
jgi:hypothetical protein